MDLKTSSSLMMYCLFLCYQLIQKYILGPTTQIEILKPTFHIGNITALILEQN